MSNPVAPVEIVMVRRLRFSKVPDLCFVEGANLGDGRHLLTCYAEDQETADADFRAMMRLYPHATLVWETETVTLEGWPR